jgi:hypothetical protein
MVEALGFKPEGRGFESRQRSLFSSFFNLSNASNLTMTLGIKAAGA